MSLRDDLLPVFQEARQLIQDFGLRTHRVYIRTRTWSGTHYNAGTKTDVDEEILPRPKVRETEGGYEISKIQPSHPGGGYTPADLLPLSAKNALKLFVVVDPDGNERECTYAAGTKSLSTDRNFGYSLQVKHIDPRSPL